MAMASLKMLDTKGPFSGNVLSLFKNPASHIHTVTLGARGFSCAVSSFGQV